MKQREKCFGDGRPLPMDRNAKARLKVLLPLLKRRTERGKHYGVITAKAVDVALALIFGFHNERTGLCFPSYEAIAEAAGCNRSYVADLLDMLERAGVITWVHRLERRTVGGLIRVFRTSNGYRLIDPATARVSIPPSRRTVKRRKLKLPARTGTQHLFQEAAIKEAWARCYRGEITDDEAASEVARLQA